MKCRQPREEGSHPRGAVQRLDERAVDLLWRRPGIEVSDIQLHDNLLPEVHSGVVPDRAAPHAACHRGRERNPREECLVDSRLELPELACRVIDVSLLAGDPVDEREL